MTELTVYHIEPHEQGAALSFHFGRQGIGLEEAGEALASDSLFAALVAQAATLTTQRGAAGEPTWATPFVAGTPPLRHSSLFPRVGELVLLPRPALAIPPMSDALRSSIGKGFKKLRYLSPALFGAVCTGQPINERPLIMQGGKVWITTSEAKSLPTPWAKAEREGDEAWQKRIEARSIWQIEEVPRVTIDRVSAASAYYEVGRVVYGQECGLALLVNFADPASKSAFEQLLTLLGENGLGGRRSSGYGAFAWKKQQPLDLKLASGSRSILLSRYIPQGAEFEALQNEGSSYQLVDVGGWLYSIGTAAQRRQRIRMVAEGSVIAMTAAHLRGDIVDVRPDYRKSRQAHPIFGKGQGTAHPVYRSGLALALPIPDTQEANNG